MGQRSPGEPRVIFAEATESAPPGRRPSPRRLVIGAAVLAGVLVVTGGATIALIDWGGRVVDAPRVDFARLVADPATQLKVFRYDDNDRVLVLSFGSLGEQGRMLNRLAALVEKEGAPRDRVLSDQELTELIRASRSSPETFYVGHDYRASDIANFFTLAAADGVILNADELQLRRLALDHGLIEEDGNGFRGTEPEQALVSTSQVQPDDPATPQFEMVDEGLRATIFRHELSHGEYFTNEAYREHCIRFWETRLTEEERGLFRNFFARMSYDPADEDLMINETQAFLMHTPDERAFNADSLGVTPAALADMRRRFLEGAPDLELLESTTALLAP